MNKKILICFGTRPEYIKIKSLVNNLSNVCTCFFGQHKDFLNFIDFNIDYNIVFNLNSSSNRLNNIFCNILAHSYIFDNCDYVLVQGDTSTSCAVALSAFHHNINVIHLEAGLRSFDSSNPFPEEINRSIISRIASIHLCPTINNKNNLIKENIFSNIFVVGNTGLDNIDSSNCSYGNDVLITMHRRDNIPLISSWFKEFNKLPLLFPNLNFILPIHPNPNIRKYSHILKNINIINPISHNSIIDIVKKSKFVISDSGGLQEECSFLKKKIIICRKNTERPECLDYNGILCPSFDKLIDIVRFVNDNYSCYYSSCPFGDGNSWYNIKNVLNDFLH